MLNEKEIFCTAFELTYAAERARYLSEACGEDHTLRARGGPAEVARGGSGVP